jgi:hypothetical protein
MSRKWEESLRETSESPQTRPAQPLKPRIGIDEAKGRIPADALDYIRSAFKSDIQRIRPYEPTGIAKH